MAEGGGGVQALFHTDWITENRQWHKQPTSCQIMNKCGSGKEMLILPLPVCCT